MKYSIDDIKMSETKEIDISQFIPAATGPVKIKIRHLTVKKRNEVTALIMKGQEFTQKMDKVELKNTDWFLEARKIELINGIVVDDDFPFNRWDETIIDEIDERCPELIAYIQNAIQDHNRPLAEENEEK